MNKLTKVKECLKDTAYIGLRLASKFLKFVGITVFGIYAIASVNNMVEEHYEKTNHPENTEEIAELNENYKSLAAGAGTGATILGVAAGAKVLVEYMDKKEKEAKEERELEDR